MRIDHAGRVIVLLTSGRLNRLLGPGEKATGILLQAYVATSEASGERLTGQLKAWRERLGFPAAPLQLGFCGRTKPENGGTEETSA